MRSSKTAISLASLVAALALIAAGVGLFSHRWGGPVSFTTLRGETVAMYGRGIYRYDTRFVGALNRGTDAVTLFFAVPLLVVAIRRYARGSLRGGLLLVAVLAYFLYVYASLALGATAYNSLFLVYVSCFAASLYGFVRAFAAIDLPGLTGRLSPRVPHRGLAWFMLACGLVTLIVWLGMGILPAMIQGGTPAGLASYSTMVTDALDLGIITPACVLAGIQVLRRAPLGYAVAVALLGILALLGPAFVAQTTSQIIAGVSFTPGEVIGPIGGFGLLSLGAIGLLIRLLSSVDDAVTPTDRGYRSLERVQRSAPTIAASP